MATLVERVQVLQGGLPLPDAVAVAQRKADIAAGTAVTADNLSDRLTEAAQSGDDTALDACLTAPVGHAAIRAAAAAVSGPVAEAALAASYARLRRRPGRGRQLAVWMQALLHSHAAHLQHSPDAAPLLGALQGGIAAAAAAQSQLLSLAGRLQLAQAQQGAGPAAPPPIQFADDDAPQGDPAAVDALVDAAHTPEPVLDEDSEGNSGGDAWASDSGDDGIASGSGSDTESGEDEEADQASLIG